MNPSVAPPVVQAHTAYLKDTVHAVVPYQQQKRDLEYEARARRQVLLVDARGTIRSSRPRYYGHQRSSACGGAYPQWNQVLVPELVQDLELLFTPRSWLVDTLQYFSRPLSPPLHLRRISPKHPLPHCLLIYLCLPGWLPAFSDLFSGRDA